MNYNNNSNTAHTFSSQSQHTLTIINSGAIAAGTMYSSNTNNNSSTYLNNTTTGSLPQYHSTWHVGPTAAMGHNQNSILINSKEDFENAISHPICIINFEKDDERGPSGWCGGGTHFSQGKHSTTTEDMVDVVAKSAGVRKDEGIIVNKSTDDEEKEKKLDHPPQLLEAKQHQETLRSFNHEMDLMAQRRNRRINFYRVDYYCYGNSSSNGAAVSGPLPAHNEDRNVLNKSPSRLTTSSKQALCPIQVSDEPQQQQPPTQLPPTKSPTDKNSYPSLTNGLAPNSPPPRPDDVVGSKESATRTVGYGTQYASTSSTPSLLPALRITPATQASGFQQEYHHQQDKCEQKYSASTKPTPLHVSAGGNNSPFLPKKAATSIMMESSATSPYVNTARGPRSTTAAFEANDFESNDLLPSSMIVPAHTGTCKEGGSSTSPLSRGLPIQIKKGPPPLPALAGKSISYIAANTSQRDVTVSSVSTFHYFGGEAQVGAPPGPVPERNGLKNAESPISDERRSTNLDFRRPTAAPIAIVPQTIHMRIYASQAPQGHHTGLRVGEGMTSLTTPPTLSECINNNNNNNNNNACEARTMESGRPFSPHPPSVSLFVELGVDPVQDLPCVLIFEFGQEVRRFCPSTVDVLASDFIKAKQAVEALQDIIEENKPTKADGPDDDNGLVDTITVNGEQIKQQGLAQQDAGNKSLQPTTTTTSTALRPTHRTFPSPMRQDHGIVSRQGEDTQASPRDLTPILTRTDSNNLKKRELSAHPKRGAETAGRVLFKLESPSVEAASGSVDIRLGSGRGVEVDGVELLIADSSTESAKRMLEAAANCGGADDKCAQHPHGQDRLQRTASNANSISKNIVYPLPDPSHQLGLPTRSNAVRTAHPHRPQRMDSDSFDVTGLSKGEDDLGRSETAFLTPQGTPFQADLGVNTKQTVVTICTTPFNARSSSLLFSNQFEDLRTPSPRPQGQQTNQNGGDQTRWKSPARHSNYYQIKQQQQPQRSSSKGVTTHSFASSAAPTYTSTANIHAIGGGEGNIVSVVAADPAMARESLGSHHDNTITHLGNPPPAPPPPPSQNQLANWSINSSYLPVGTAAALAPLGHGQVLQANPSAPAHHPAIVFSAPNRSSFQVNEAKTAHNNNNTISSVQGTKQQQQANNNSSHNHYGAGSNINNRSVASLFTAGGASTAFIKPYSGAYAYPSMTIIYPRLVLPPTPQQVAAAGGSERNAAMIIMIEDFIKNFNTGNSVQQDTLFISTRALEEAAAEAAEKHFSNASSHSILCGKSQQAAKNEKEDAVLGGGDGHLKTSSPDPLGTQDSANQAVLRTPQASLPPVAPTTAAQFAALQRVSSLQDPSAPLIDVNYAAPFDKTITFGEGSGDGRRRHTVAGRDPAAFCPEAPPPAKEKKKRKKYTNGEVSIVDFCC